MRAPRGQAPGRTVAAEARAAVDTASASATAARPVRSGGGLLGLESGEGALKVPVAPRTCGEAAEGHDGVGPTTLAAVVSRVEAEEKARKAAVADLVAFVNLAVASIHERLNDARPGASTGASAVAGAPAVGPGTKDPADGLTLQLAGRCDELAAEQVRAMHEHEAGVLALTEHVSEALQAQSLRVQRTARGVDEIGRIYGKRLERLEEGQRHLGQAVADLARETHKRTKQLGEAIAELAQDASVVQDVCSEDFSTVLRQPLQSFDETSDGSTTQAPGSPEREVSSAVVSTMAGAVASDRASLGVTVGSLGGYTRRQTGRGSLVGPEADVAPLGGSVQFCAPPAVTAAVMPPAGEANLTASHALLRSVPQRQSLLASRSASPTMRAGMTSVPAAPPAFPVTIQTAVQQASSPKRSSIGAMWPGAAAAPALQTSGSSARAPPAWSQAPVVFRSGSPSRPSVSRAPGTPLMGSPRPVAEQPCHATGPAPPQPRAGSAVQPAPRAAGAEVLLQSPRPTSPGCQRPSLGRTGSAVLSAQRPLAVRGAAAATPATAVRGQGV
mmetsp:Transcript_107419/g.333823  ORF Transcript_107419/g.333823 Transcript_107419/m.333823 type:complete len:557 (-) Transcript_107419:91-1761(-)